MTLSTLKRFLVKFRPVSIRTRLLLAFLLMVLIPSVAFGAISGIVGLERGREQVIDKLTSVAVLKEDELNAWAQNAKTDLVSVMIGEDVQQSIQTTLSSKSNPDDLKSAYDQLHNHFGIFLEQTNRFEELHLLNTKGMILLSSDRQREGGIGARAIQAYVSSGGENEYLHPPSYNLASLTDNGVGIVVVQPIYNANEQLLGILAGRASSVRLDQIMLERTGLGETGETYLIASNQVMLTEPRFPSSGIYDSNYVFSEGAKEAARHHTNGAGIYTNHRGETVVGVYRWLPNLQLALLAEQSESEAMADVRQTMIINVSISAIALLIAGAVSVVLTRSIAMPLSDLAKTAVRASGGELNLTVPVEREDEIGAVAKAFNNMTARLRELINSLDQQVKERTQMLRQRAVQMETSVQVGREITSILEMEELLGRIVSLIAEAFGYYYVRIFLVDTESGQLILRAVDGEIKNLDRAKQETFAIGPGSLNGEAANSNKKIVVNDVSQDSRYYADKQFPDTRSELVIPLRIGERVIGTLDVLSKEIGTFSAEDVRIVQGLGDQVAVAIENAQLYARSRALAVMEERNRLARELHDSVTQSLYSMMLLSESGRRLAHSGAFDNSEDFFAELWEIARQSLKEMRFLVHELRPPTMEVEGLVGALQQRLDAVEGRSGMETRLLVNGKVNLPSAVEETLYRIALEAMNNTLKHASADSLTVCLDCNNSFFVFEIQDNGQGFDLENAKRTGGLGLKTMNERAESLGGELKIHSSPGEGTIISIKAKVANE